MKTKREIRTISGEIRADNESRTIEGYAAVFDQETDLGFFREVVRRSAFDGADTSDVRALFNHDPNLVLARTASGTLQLSVDDTGLRYRFEAPNTTLGNDLLEMIRRGDISQSSFAFTVETAKWKDEEDKNKASLREIEKIGRLFDVSPVTYPAYEGTSVQARSLEQIVSDEHPEKPEEEADDENEKIIQERQMMDDRVRAAQFSLIKNSVNHDH